MNSTLVTIICLVILLLSPPIFSQRYLGYRPTDSGGLLMPEQAAYDVTFYELSLEVKPETRSIAGSLTVHAKVVHPLEWFVLDLDRRLGVTSVQLLNFENEPVFADFEHRNNKLWIHLNVSRQPGEAVAVRVHYHGQPKVAPAPPWVGGFTWAKTAGGQPWIATSVQLDGGDLWWPCKDHPSDEPDSMAINITIAKPLILASNGVLREVIDNNDGTSTFHWFVTNPINNYDVALNIAPYRIIEGTFNSVGGKEIPVAFWALPEHFEKAKQVFPQLSEHLAFYEKYLGPYPFRNEKYGVTETPHLGMEHQTVIAYGRYRNNEFGYDELHHHELGHEWWGNLVTAFDWRDFWLHEGFCAYMQALYVEELHGGDAYHRFFETRRPLVRNITTLAPREPTSAMERYFVAPEFIESDGDIYTKGALVLHALRYLIGKEDFLKSLRRFAYPSPELEKVTDGRQCRFATTDDFLKLVEDISGKDLDWFFDVYVRQPVLPRLVTGRQGDSLQLEWEVPGDLRFPMPVEVNIENRIEKIEMPDGKATVKLDKNAEWEVDPEDWIFRHGNWKAK
ncbi:M1 family metallopeptidase [candidate division KSB1 bacterium]|nr:M1 family metallopeptidase [candidate division KSB1 bacterium]NIR72342.1 M1 family metallopeptidase [candidate division KSB1 bacterium]NIS25048.1 M1 family metallopeptidase [candidate division KSB1 bacterium]NIT71969.1 M1 family metallopeptidase [candidate division KSB1 bacterium]NIU25725.1 M1 family metallopeptidase [candidate division KSB1 bacterium]